MKGGRVGLSLARPFHIMKAFLENQGGAVVIEFALVLSLVAIPAVMGGAILGPVILDYATALSAAIADGQAVLIALEAAAL